MTLLGKCARMMVGNFPAVRGPAINKSVSGDHFFLVPSKNVVSTMHGPERINLNHVGPDKGSAQVRFFQKGVEIAFDVRPALLDPLGHRSNQNAVGGV